MGSVIERLRRVRREALGLNRRNHELLLRLNRPALVALVDHKFQTKDVLSRHGIPVPETFGRYTRQRELPALVEVAAQHEQFVLKPARGAGGEGVLVVAGTRDGKLVKPSGGLLTASDLMAHAADIIAGAFSLSQARDEALLEYCLTPEPGLAAFSPGGIPDLRLVIASGVPVMAMLRLPTRASDGRANLHVGGIGVGIDLRTGHAVHAIWHDRTIAVHPDTQEPLSNVHIQGWDDLLLLGARCYEAIPLGYMGIDVVIDARHGPVILEINARPGLSIQLANRRGLRPTLDRLQQHARAALSAAERVALGVRIAAEIQHEA